MPEESQFPPLESTEIRKGYPVYTAAEVAQWPPVNWLIPGVIQEQSSVLIYGESRIGKSFLALDLASKLASGSKWFGYSTKPCRVIFLAAESPAGLNARVRANSLREGQSASTNLMFMRSQIDLSNSDDIDKLIVTVEGLADVLIIDTLSAASAELDENSSSAMGKLLSGIRRIVSEGRCTTILVHHCGWSDHDRPRGHSSLAAAMDTRIQVVQKSGHPSWRVKGQREGADTEFHRYALRTIEIPEIGDNSCVVEPLSTEPAVKARQVPSAKNQRIALEVLGKFLGGTTSQNISRQELIDLAAPSMTGDTRHKKQRSAEAIKSLTENGFLQVDADEKITLSR